MASRAKESPAEVTGLRSVPPLAIRTGTLSERQKEVLDGIRDRVLTNGFRSLRLTDIAAELNTSYATLYAIARTKDELVTIVLDRWFQEAIAGSLAALESLTDPIERLELWLTYGAAGVSATGSGFWNDLAGHPGLSQLFDGYGSYYVGVLEELIQDGIDRGRLRPVNVRALGLMWWGAGLNLRDPAYLARLPVVPLDELWANWIDLLFHGILADQSAETPVIRALRR